MMGHRSVVGATFVAYWLGAAIIGFFLVHTASWPDGSSPLSTQAERQVTGFIGMQETWQFFEKDLKAEQVFVYRKDGQGHWTKVGPTANGEPGNSFGISRRPRKEAVERNRVVFLVPAARWQPCVKDVELCLADIKEPAVVKDTASNPVMCGTFALVKSEPTHWAWAAKSRALRGVRVALVESKC